MRRLRAEARYGLWVARSIRRPLVAFGVVLVLGALVEHAWGPHQDWSQAFFISYTLMFLEHLEPTPEHPLAQLMHYGQPLLGLIFVSDGVIRLGVNLLNKDANARIWVQCMAAATKGHVIVCGLGTVGFRTAEELRRMRIEVFAVERDADGTFVQRAREIGVNVLIGDARSENVVSSLNVRDARAVIVVTNDDLANLEIAMDVRELRRDVPVVMRLFDQKLADKVKATLGVNTSVSTSRLAAPLFASAALHPSVVGVHRIGETVLVVVQVKLGPGGTVRGRTAGELASQGLTVIATRRGVEPWELSPRPDRTFGDGDEVQILVPSARVDEVHRLAAG